MKRWTRSTSFVLVMSFLGLGSCLFMDDCRGAESISGVDNPAVNEAVETAEAQSKAVSREAIAAEAEKASVLPQPQAKEYVWSYSMNLEAGGYVNAGTYCNTRGSHYLDPVNSCGENGGALNGIYTFLKKEANTEGCGTDWGFGTDFMFGQDRRNLCSYKGLDEKWYTGHNSRGDETYGFAMPQLYGEFAVNDWTFQFGHIYSFLGWESCRADERFFYSYGHEFSSVPGTQTGFWASYNGFENLEMTIGWNNGVDAGFDNDASESLFVGKFTYHMNDKIDLGYVVNAGKFSYENWYGSYYWFSPEEVLDDNASGAVNTFSLTWALTDKLDYEAVIDYSSLTCNGVNNNYRTLSQYLYYTVNDCWKWGARIEWLKLHHVLGTGEVTSLTFGANWTPFQNKNLLIRPEIRYDSSTQPMFNDGNNDDQLCLGFDVMYKF